MIIYKARHTRKIENSYDIGSMMFDRYYKFYYTVYIKSGNFSLFTVAMLLKYRKNNTTFAALYFVPAAEDIWRPVADGPNQAGL